MKQRVIVLVVALLAISCDMDIQSENNQQIVVEGWIESDGYPVVLLTSTVNAGNNFKEWKELKENVIRWAKVTVSDGEKEVVLTGKPNNDYFPPYIYTTARIRGVAGKKYTLKVEYSGRTVTAETSIPSPVSLEWIQVKRAENGIDACIIAGLKDNPDTKDYYKFFVKERNKDSTFVSAFMGIIDDSLLESGINEIRVQGSMPITLGTEDNSLSFSDDTFVFIRLSNMDEVSYRYWEDFEDIYSLSRLPLFTINRPIRSNINGGLGYWAGYGSTEYAVSVADSLRVK